MSFSAIDGYAVVADLACGDNSQTGIPELALGSSATDQVTDNLVWDSDLSDGFDTGWVQLEVDWDTSRQIALTVGDVKVAYNAGPYDDIYGFLLRAGVSAADSTVAFRNIKAQFFQGSNMQTGVCDDGQATTVGTNQPDAEDILITIPEGGGFQSAKLFVQVRMQSP